MTQKDELKILQLEIELKKINEEVREVQSKKNDIKDKIFDIQDACLRKYLVENVVMSEEEERRLTIDDVYVSDWDCKESINGLCCNDTTEDEHNCIFCGNPDERK